MFAVIVIPDFALQSVLRLEPELATRPVALIDGVEQPGVVLQFNSVAGRAGIVAGLTPTQAMARCGEVIVRPRSLLQETAASEALLQCAYNVSPRIEATANGVCTLDLQGLAVENCSATTLDWTREIVAALERVQLKAQVGVAATPQLARYAARCAAPLAVVTEPEEFVAALPVEILEPTPEVFGVLRRWGIRTVGAFVALGKVRIAERLGVEALDLFRRASVTESRPLELVTPPETFSEAMDFAHEVETLEPLLFVLNRFVGQLAARLDVLGLVVAGLELRLKLASGSNYERFFQVPAPTNRTDTLLRMLQTHLEGVRTESPIVSLQLAARPSEARAHQFGLFEAKLRNPDQFHHTLARLSALCGAENVGTPVVADSFRPDAFRMETPRFDAPVATTIVETPSQGFHLRRFRPAFHADVETENGAPKYIASLKLNSRVARALGPWRSSGDWWEQSKQWQRDVWDVQAADGRLYRIFRERDDWFVEGVYD